VKRRAFCVHTCQFVSLAAVGAAIEACGGSPSSPSGSSAPALPTINGASSSGGVAVTIDASSPLAAAGGAALVQSPSASFLVSRGSANDFTALTALCTHEQCTVSGFQNSRYVCPCHGSQYSLTGAVLQGPAPRPLQQFQTAFANNVLTIRT
jgi:cytochrome b6-f complex iron-sulfur subunit